MLVDGKVSEQFEISTGVLQGDTLAPFLFIIVIDFVLSRAEQEHAEKTGSHGFTMQERQSSRHPAKALFDLDFADDIALLEGGSNNTQRNIENSQAQLITTAKWARRVGLEVNIKKTEAFSTNEHASHNMPIDTHRARAVHRARRKHNRVDKRL